MKKTAFVYLLLVFFVFAILIWCYSNSKPESGIVIKPKPLPTKTFHQSPSDYNRFAIESYSKIARAKGDQNAVFSPFSLSMALEVLYAGSAGNTATELQNMLHLPPQSNHEKPQNPALFEYKSPKKAIIDPMSYGDHPPIFLAGNSIWYADHLTLNRSFEKAMKKDFSLETFPVNFAANSGQIVADMDQWVNRVTQGLIPSLNPSAGPDSTLVILNTLYFKAFWNHRFETRNTHDRKFTLVTGEEIETPCMGDESGFPFMQNEEFKALEMPYIQGWDDYKSLESNFSMLFILPHKVDGIYALEEKLTEELLQEIVQSLSNTGLFVSIPKFRLEQENDLRTVLGSAIDEPDLSGMFVKPSIELPATARQKIVLGIDEHGTEAAVFLEFAYLSLGSDPPVFIVDHPFLFLIRERKSGTIFFLGRVMNPNEK